MPSHSATHPLPSDLPPQPRERILALASTGVAFLILYNLSNWLASLHASVPTAAFSWEYSLPLVPILILPYWSIDLLFVLAPFVVSTRRELLLLRRRLLCAIVGANFFFILFPLQLEFTRTRVDPPLGLLFDALHSFDRVYNLAPSLHIAITVVLWTVYVPRCKGFAAPLAKLWFALIWISTLLCHQHHVIDLFTGQLFGMFVLCGTTLQSTPRTLSRAAHQARLRIALRYLFGAVLCALLAVLTWLPGVLLLWPATALLTVALAYLRDAPAIFGKEQGRSSLAARILLAPYRWGAHLTYLYYTWGTKPWVEVAPNILLGRRLSTKEAEKLMALPHIQILDVTAEYNEHPRLLGSSYHHVPLLDLVPPAPEELERAVTTVLELRSSGPVFIHCSLGRTRSAIVAAKALVSSGEFKNEQEALQHIRTLRPEVTPSSPATENRKHE